MALWLIKVLVSLGILFPRHGVVLEKLSEGYAVSNDVYIVQIENDFYEVESDDLYDYDEVTCYFLGNDIIIQTLYGWRWKSPSF